MSKVKQTKIPVTLGLDEIKFKTGNSNYELFKI
jgi:hypothetical protein